MNWNYASQVVTPYLVRVETPEGSGTGFLFGYNADKGLCAIGTAAHVVNHAFRWRQPISLIHHASGAELFLTHEERIIDIDIRHDAASIVLPAGGLDLPPRNWTDLTASPLLTVEDRCGRASSPKSRSSRC